MQSRSVPRFAGQADGAVSRRTLLKTGLCGAAGLLGGGLAGTAAERCLAAATPSAGPAKAVIQIWLWGGPAHLDTFDPKPEAGSDYTGVLDKTLDTNVEGIRIGQLLPELAKHADKYSILRGMTHGINGHETASYMVQTGRQPGGRLVYPSVGAVVSLFKGYDAGYEGLIPPYIVLTSPQGRFSEAGFLGPKYKPFATGGDPAKTPFAVEGVVAVGISERRQRERRDLLTKLDALQNSMPDNPHMKAFSKCRDQAYDLILGDGAKVFDLSSEDDELRQRYGRNTFGQSCLMARRLVEKGVRYVTINYKGWDTHKEHFQAMRRKLPEMDRGFATLLQDLSERNLLDSTIVWWGGEFGRTPKVLYDAPWNGGRGHYGRAFCSVIAGGGFKGGHVVGATDSRGETVKERPIYPWDLIGSIYTQLGIDPKGSIKDPDGNPVRLTLSKEDGVEAGGLLTEIMKTGNDA